MNDEARAYHESQQIERMKRNYPRLVAMINMILADGLTPYLKERSKQILREIDE